MKKRIKELVNSKLYFSIYCVLFTGICCSFASELFWGCSIYETLVLCGIIPKGWFSVPEILQANSVFEVMKILGFGSALFAWAEAALKKKVMGITYSDLLPQIYKYANKILHMHFVATVASFMFGAAGASEGAAISLILVYMGFVYLWVIVDGFLFSSDTREYQAAMKWNAAIKEVHRRCDSKAMWENLQILIKELNNAEVGHFEILISSIADAMLSYATFFERKGRRKTQLLINELSRVWETFASFPGIAKYGLREKLFVKICQSCYASGFSVAAIGCSYVLFLFQSYLNKMGNEREESLEDCMLKVHNELFSMVFGLNSQCKTYNLPFYNELKNYLNTTYMMLVWMLFYKGQIPLSRALLLETSPSTEQRKMLIFEAMCSIFMKDENDSDFNDFVSIFQEIGEKFGWNDATGGTSYANKKNSSKKDASTC